MKRSTLNLAEGLAAHPNAPKNPHHGVYSPDVDARAAWFEEMPNHWIKTMTWSRTWRAIGLFVVVPYCVHKLMLWETYHRRMWKLQQMEDMRAKYPSKVFDGYDGGAAYHDTPRKYLLYK